MFDCMHLCFIPCFESVYCLKDRSLPSVVAQRDVVWTKGYARISRFSEGVRGALLLIFIGGSVWNVLHGLWCLDQIPQRVSIPFMLFAAVGIINAINLIDGVDGLSSGYCILTSLLFGMMFWYVEDRTMGMLAVVATGSLIPFFFHNVFGKSSKMFIGDGGTLVMGIVMSVLVIRILRHGSMSEVYDAANIGLISFTLAVLSVSVFDTLRVMTTRILKRKSPFHPDKTHLHHMFIRLGCSHAATTPCDSDPEFLRGAVLVGQLHGRLLD